MQEQDLIPIYPKIGADSLRKLHFIASVLYPEWAREGKKSGDPLNQTLSYCIEATYNILEKSRAMPPIYDALPPPKTVKAQALYDIFQRITTMKDKGKSLTEIVAYLNQAGYPTPDDLYSTKPLTAINFKISRWEKRDVRMLFADGSQPGELLRQYLDKLNKRSQRKRAPGVRSSR